ncbi:succinate dehydrogenase, cytochrome b556 subunit [Marinihelvus fidelis]|uniref:Succinate dehydrogenase cytochrome b556 subunit n=1 Tax=Marinihelvus fidelis TaxID=2613842 RepID=A0A5N0TAD0_9GAMM|nr:succinate dehydrogenase, cytochrome b556 subunit [Marinihelvus fidelis]KAA9131955.1 succinate dehydrogenase, cytochrome b556 subunit [Marinihelvus fidelis]
MNDPSRQRPLSPYMLGPYYRFQITSLLSISGRITGMLLAAVTLPALLAWLLALAAGPDSFAATQAWFSGICGKLVLAVSLLCLSFHLLNGLRHLAWDAGKGFEMASVRASGWAVIIGTFVLTALVWWCAS